MRPEYIKYISDKIQIPIEELTYTEMEIINVTFDLYREKMDDIRMLNHDIKKLQKAYIDLKRSTNDLNDD